MAHDCSGDPCILNIKLSWPRIKSILERNFVCPGFNWVLIAESETTKVTSQKTNVQTVGCTLQSQIQKVLLNRGVF